MDHRLIAIAVVAFAVGCPDSQVQPEPPGLPDLHPDAAEEEACTTPPPVGRARAKHVRCETELSSGPLAMGRLGDVLLENARVRVIVRAAAESATTIGAPGGGIVDASLQDGVRHDGVKEVLPLLSNRALLAGSPVVARAGGEEAVVRAPFTTGPLKLIEAVIPVMAQPLPVHGVLEYRLRADEDVVRVRLCALVDADSEDGPELSASPGFGVLLAGAAEILAPGFGVLDGDHPSANAAALYAEAPFIAYGARVAGTNASVLHAGTVTLFGGLKKTTYTRIEARCAELLFAVAPTEAGVAEALTDPAQTQVLEVDVPTGGRAEIADAGGSPALRSREIGGKVRARIGSGTTSVRVARAGGIFGDRAAPPSTGTLVVRPMVTGEAGVPVRITVLGLDGLDVERRFVAVGETRVALPVGHYRVSASRGGEYTLDTTEVTLAADGVAELAPRIDHVVDTAGYVAADFHLHTELSTDSTHPVEDAVRQMAAEGLEVLASTDHDLITDLDAVAGATDARGWIVAVPGEEVSTTAFGHINGYPLHRDPEHAGVGAVPWFDLPPSAIFAGLRARGDDVVVQVNHPHLGRSSFFEAIGLDAATATVHGDPVALGLPAGTDLSDLSFEALEVWNGYTRGGNEQTFTDFLALRLAGRRYLMVGNSDSHRPDLPPGAPRSYIRVPDDGRGRFGWSDVRAGMHTGDISVGAGIFVEAFAAGGARPGGLATASAGRVMLHVRVQAPPWADCNRLRVYRGTAVVLDRPIVTPADRVVRVDEDLAIDTPTDTFLVVRADGGTDAKPVFPWPPFGVTNPLQIDADGDGK